MLIEQTVQCPYCGESYPSTVDISGREKQYVQDCYACFRPITICVKLDVAGSLEGIEIHREDE